MNAFRPENRSVLWATVDVILSFVGFYILLYPAFWAGNSILGSPVSDATIRVVVGLLAFGGAYPVVAGDWSAKRLGEFVFAFVVSVFLIGIFLAFTMAILGLEISSENSLPTVLMFALSYLLSYLSVRIDIF